MVIFEKLLLILLSLLKEIGYLLGLPSKKLDAVVYYERYVVINPGNVEGVEKLDLLSEEEYMNIMDQLPEENRYLEDGDPNKFVAKMGAEAIYELLQEIDLVSLAAELRHKANTDGSQQRKTEALKRLQVVNSFLSSANVNKPEWMVLKAVPVIPPELRPLVPLDGGRFATSDLNDLYRRVIIRNSPHNVRNIPRHQASLKEAREDNLSCWEANGNTRCEPQALPARYDPCVRGAPSSQSPPRRFLPSSLTTW